MSVYRTSLRLIALAWLFDGAQSFHLDYRIWRQARHSRADRSMLLAKKPGKTTKARQTPSRGGFGLSSNGQTTVTKADDAYSVFPALEPNIRQTLIPTTNPETVGELTNDIYGRLKHIYGFPSFNYQTEEKARDEPISAVGDLLSIETKSSVPESLSSVNDAAANPSAIDFLSVDSKASFVPRSAAQPTIDLSAFIDQLPAFQRLSVLHVDPLVLSISDFFTHEECDQYVRMVQTSNLLESRSPTVGKDQYSKSQRTSTTWYNEYKNVPELLAKACRLLGLSDICHWEEPQIVRYRNQEKFTWHLDALGPSENEASLGGQRTATLLVYLTELQPEDGGATVFRDLGGGDDGAFLKVRPTKGSALLFFPAAGGIPETPYDIRTVHAGEAVAANAENDKWISQIWLREGIYKPTLGNHEDAAEAIAKYCQNLTL
jgi:hypothetical protein